MLSKRHRFGLISVASVFSLGCASASTPDGLASTVSCSLAGEGRGSGSHPEFCVEESGLTNGQAEGAQTGDAGVDAVAALLCNTNQTFIAP
jgi:hypothetical protein